MEIRVDEERTEHTNEKDVSKNMNGFHSDQNSNQLYPELH